MSITALFEKLSAPLANSRWSWGGFNEENKRVFLRAWQDQTQLVDGKRLIRLAHHHRYADQTDNPGYNERIKHLALAKSGYETYVLMCNASDLKTRPRTIKSFDRRDVFKIGSITNIEGDEWGELVERVSIRSFK